MRSRCLRCRNWGPTRSDSSINLPAVCLYVAFFGKHLDRIHICRNFYYWVKATVFENWWETCKNRWDLVGWHCVNVNVVLPLLPSELLAPSQIDDVAMSAYHRYCANIYLSSVLIYVGAELTGSRAVLAYFSDWASHFCASWYCSFSPCWWSCWL